MASSLPAGRSEVECSDLSIKIEFRPRRSTDSPRPSCSSPQDAKRQDRDPPDPKSTSVVSEVYPLQTRMRPNLVDPFGLADSASAWQVGWEWLSGTDSRRHDFTDGDQRGRRHGQGDPSGPARRSSASRGPTRQGQGASTGAGARPRARAGSRPRAFDTVFWRGGSGSLFRLENTAFVVDATAGRHKLFQERESARKNGGN